MNWSSAAIPSITDKQNQLPLVILSTSFIHLTSSKTTSGKLSTERIHFHKAQENFFGPVPLAERQLEDTLICCVNKLSCWFHFGVYWSVITKSIWWNDPGLSDSYRRDGKQKNVGLNRSLSHHLSPYCQKRSNKGTWTIKPSLGNCCFAHDRHQSLFKSKSFWNNYGMVSSTEKNEKINQDCLHRGDRLWIFKKRKNWDEKKNTKILLNTWWNSVQTVNVSKAALSNS